MMRFRLVSVAVAVTVGVLVCAAGSAAAPASCPTGWTQNRQPNLTGALPCNFADVGFGGPGHARDTTETVTVPAGVSVLHVNAVGGVGDSPDCNYPDEVYGDLAVQPGEQLTVIAGNAGQHLSQPAGDVPAIPGQGGFGGGGNGGTGYNGAGNGGGGGSFVFGPSGVLLVSGGTGGAFEQRVFEAWGGGGQAWASTQMECPLSTDDPPATLSTAGAGLAGGQGATGSGAGAGGAGPSDGTDGTSGGGPASSPGSLGTGGQGATGNVDNQGSNGGGGGGGGYYGGGGGGDASGGGSGSDYLSASLVAGSGHDIANPGWKYGDANGGGGVVDLSFTPPAAQTISGTVSEPDGSGYPGETVTLTGTDSMTAANVDEQTQTDPDGAYSFEVDPGSYTVTPAQPSVPGDGQILVTSCSGTQQPQACQIALGQGQSGTANFRRTTLIVTSTQSGTDAATVAEGDCDLTPTGAAQTCTLAQAIEIANGRPGSVIGFDIQAGDGNTFDGAVPQIEYTSGSGLPPITARTTIDGSSQPGAGRVELSGTSGDNGLAQTMPVTVGLSVGAAGSVVKGMVINGYSDGIDLHGGGDSVVGDWLGTDAAGTAATPNPLGTNTTLNQLIGQIGVYLDSSGNVISQSVFATHWGVTAQTRPAAAIYDAVGGNTIQGDQVGVVPGTQNPLADPKTQFAAAVPFWPGLYVGAGADTIGGTAPGTGNVLAPVSTIDGNSVVQGNTFLGEVTVSGNVQVGGATNAPGTGPGNIFTETPSIPSTRLLDITGGVVQGNHFSDSDDPAIVAGNKVTIGGTAADLGNQIDHVATNAVFPDGERPEVDGAITLTSSDNLVENNVLSDNGGRAAVQVDDGDRNTITRNSMSGNTQGIVLGLDYVANGQQRPALTNPNDYQPYPVLRSAESHASGTEITGLYEEPASFRLVHSITVDLYAMKTCGTAASQGEVYLGSRALSVSLGESDFMLTFDPLPAGPGYDAVTATATAPDGSTSEFSPCFTIGSHPDPFLKVGVGPITRTVAITTSSTPSGAADATIASAMRGRGRGTLLLYCPPSAVRYCRGTFTLRSGGRTLDRGRFKIAPGYADPISLTIGGKLLVKLERAHRLRVKLVTDARDAAKRRNHKRRSTTVTLLYR